MAYLDCVLIISASFLSALLSEAISWVLIYRTPHYKALSKDIERLNAKIEKAKDRVSGSNKRSNKQVSQYDDQLKLKTRDLTIAKMKSGIFVMGIMLGFLALLNNEFNGVVVAKLPFTPIPLIRGITHRNLPGLDFTDCSMTFIYVLCSMSFRSNVQKALGFSPPKTQSIFDQPIDK